MRAAFGIALLMASAFPAYAAGNHSELDGVWILFRAEIGKVQLTPEGEKKRAAYDFQKDDPDFECKPASITRVMHTPSPPIEVRQHGDRVEVNYEFMDIHRSVPLKKGLLPKDAPYAVKNHPHLGRSAGRYDGEALVVETQGVGAGIMDTLGVPGLYQSDQMHFSERFIPNGDKMQIVVTHEDPVYLAAPLVVTFNYVRLPGGKIEKWDCKPEEATYKRFGSDKK